MERKIISRMSNFILRVNNFYSDHFVVILYAHWLIPLTIDLIFGTWFYGMVFAIDIYLGVILLPFAFQWERRNMLITQECNRNKKINNGN
jgi:hypothetical protein